jgi:hypothetical protein
MRTYANIARARSVTGQTAAGKKPLPRETEPMTDRECLARSRMCDCRGVRPEDHSLSACWSPSAHFSIVHAATDARVEPEHDARSEANVILRIATGAPWRDAPVGEGSATQRPTVNGCGQREYEPRIVAARFRDTKQARPLVARVPAANA